MVGGEEAMLAIDLTLPPIIIVLVDKLEDLTGGELDLVLLLSFIGPNGPENLSNHLSALLVSPLVSQYILSAGPSSLDAQGFPLR